MKKKKRRTKSTHLIEELYDWSKKSLIIRFISYKQGSNMTKPKNQKNKEKNKQYNKNSEEPIEKQRINLKLCVPFSSMNSLTWNQKESKQLNPERGGLQG